MNFSVKPIDIDVAIRDSAQEKADRAERKKLLDARV
jgi:hypothetical protein